VRVGGETIAGVPEADVECTSAAGKASSVQFIHFPFTDAQVATFRQAGATGGAAAGVEIVAGFTHPETPTWHACPSPCARRSPRISIEREVPPARFRSRLVAA